MGTCKYDHVNRFKLMLTFIEQELYLQVNDEVLDTKEGMHVCLLNRSYKSAHYIIQNAGTKLLFTSVKS